MSGYNSRRLVVMAMVALAAAGGGMPALIAATAPPPPDGKELYRTRCGMCHQGIGMAVSLLSRRPGDTSKGLLENRKDLSVEFVFTAARTGIGNMPRIARGEVSDAELTAIGDYLTQGKP